MKGAIELPSFTGKITGLRSLVHTHLNKDRAGGNCAHAFESHLSIHVWHMVQRTESFGLSMN